MDDDSQSPEPRAFRTPDSAAAADDINTPAANLNPPEERSQGWRSRLAWLRQPMTKKKWAAAIAVLLVIAASGVLAYKHFHKPAPAPVVYKKAAVPAVKTDTRVPSALTGLLVDPSFNSRPVTGVMIENSIAARPQSGLSEAGVVFEAIAEGGITRFLALFQDTAPEVGPVRSARPYYVQWAMGFDAGYAHVGGSPEALQDIRNWGTKDLDQFFNAAAFRREASREAPHNVYTNLPTLWALASSKGYTGSVFTGFVRKKDAPAKLPTAKAIDLAISGPAYNVHYDYDPKTNSYPRVMAGAPHIDANNNAQIRPKVVVALVMPYGLASDNHHSVYGTIGSGPALVFQDGTVTRGQWTKADNASNLSLTDAAGAALKLNAGQTWFTALASESQAAYAP